MAFSILHTFDYFEQMLSVATELFYIKVNLREPLVVHLLCVYTCLCAAYMSTLCLYP